MTLQENEALANEPPHILPSCLDQLHEDQVVMGKFLLFLIQLLQGIHFHVYYKFVLQKKFEI